VCDVYVRASAVYGFFGVCLCSYVCVWRPVHVGFGVGECMRICVCVCLALSVYIEQRMSLSMKLILSKGISLR